MNTRRIGIQMIQNNGNIPHLVCDPSPAPAATILCDSTCAILQLPEAACIPGLGRVVPRAAGLEAMTSWIGATGPEMGVTGLGGAASTAAGTRCCTDVAAFVQSSPALILLLVGWLRTTFTAHTASNPSLRQYNQCHAVQAEGQQSKGIAVHVKADQRSGPSWPHRPA